MGLGGPTRVGARGLGSRWSELLIRQPLVSLPVGCALVSLGGGGGASMSVQSSSTGKDDVAQDLGVAQ